LLQRGGRFLWLYSAYVCAEHFCNDNFITNYAVSKCLSEDKEKIEKVRTPDRLDMSIKHIVGIKIF